MKEKYEVEFEEEPTEEEYQEPTCTFCWDSRKKKDKNLTFFDQANNLRICNYCPWCGRKIGG